MTLDISYRNVDLEVHGEYIPFERGNWDYPDEGGYFEVDKVCVGEIEVTELVDIHMDDIAEIAYNEVRD
jgi:hypothetical protein